MTRLAEIEMMSLVTSLHTCSCDLLHGLIEHSRMYLLKREFETHKFPRN